MFLIYNKKYFLYLPNNTTMFNKHGLFNSNIMINKI